MLATPIELKKCSSCKEMLNISAFSAASNYKDGYRGQCRKCRAAYTSEYKTRPSYRPSPQKARPPRVSRPAEPEKDRRRRLHRKYGMSVDQFDAMLEIQGGCAVCESAEPRGRHPRFVVDHCHKTGLVRGILCTPCNSGLGFFNEDIAALKRAVAYLRGENAALAVLGAGSAPSGRTGVQSND